MTTSNRRRSRPVVGPLCLRFALPARLQAGDAVVHRGPAARSAWAQEDDLSYRRGNVAVTGLLGGAVWQQCDGAVALRRRSEVEG